MQIQRLQGPATALGGFYYPLFEGEAAHKIQGCFRQFQDNNRRFFESNFSTLLSRYANEIPLSEDKIREFIPFFYKRAQTLRNQDFQMKDDIGGYARYRNRTFSFIMQLDAIEHFEGSYKKIFAALKTDINCSKRTFEASPQALVTLQDPQHPPPPEVAETTIYEEDGYITPPSSPYEENGYITPPSSPTEEEIDNRRLARAEVLLKTIAQQIIEDGVQNKVYIIPPISPVEEKGMLPWYPADLSRAVKNEFLELDTNTAVKYPPFTYLNALYCLFDVMRTLHWLHFRGYVHRDVKNPNILLQWSPERNRYLGVLGDCDFLKQGFGWDKLCYSNNEYPCWEITGLCNILTPYVDRYALALSLAVLNQTNPNWKKYEKWRDFITASVVLNSPHKLEWESSSLTALTSVCHESTRMLLHILHHHGIDPVIDIRRRHQKKHPNAPHTYVNPKLVVAVLQDIVERHKDLFTHEAIVEAMRQVSQEMQKEGKTVYTIEKIGALIVAKIHEEEAAAAQV